jgi:iron complex outermembrane recepter protein
MGMVMRVGITAATCAVALCAMAGDALAQVEEVVVTARKREETLQSVPVAVAALRTEDLQRAGAASLADVARLTPGLTFYQGNAGTLTAPTIRGLSVTVTNKFDSNVGVFLDGVFLSAKANVNVVDLFALERVEIVRGPQSALYGNNTFSGAINYVTRKPGDTFEGQVRATIGSDGLYEGMAAVQGGVVPGKLRGRVTASYSTFDGTLPNTIDNRRFGGWDYRKSASASLYFTPTDALDAQLFYYFGAEHTPGSANYMYANDCGGLNSPAVPGRARTTLRYKCGELTAQPLSIGPGTFSKTRSQLAYLQLGYDFGPAKLKSVTSAGRYDSSAIEDQKLDTTTPAQSRIYVLPFTGPVVEHSQEVRLESYGNRVIDWAAGAYYFHRNATQNQKNGNGPAQFPVTLDQVTKEATQTLAGFALAQVNVAEGWRVNGEARWTRDEKNGLIVNNLTRLQVALPATFRYWTWRASVDYRPTDQVMFYASVARGAKSGGSNNSAVASEQTFGPEFNTTYEVGAKTKWLDGKLTVNAALFSIDWSSVQLPVPSAIAGQSNYTTNFGDATSRGVELEVSATPLPNWVITAGVGYSDPTWNSNTIDYSSTRSCATAAACGLKPAGINNTGFDVSGFVLPRASRWTASGSSTYTWKFDRFDVYLRGDVSYRGRQVTAPIALQYIGDQTLTNLRLGALIGQAEIAFWVNNLFDEAYVQGSINEPEFVPSGTYTTGFLMNRRTFGITGTYKF